MLISRSKLILAAICGLGLLAGPACAQDNGLPAIKICGPTTATGLNCSTPFSGVPLGYQQLTSLSSATALTVPAGSTYAVVTPESQAVRWRDDGTNPTATVGMPIAVGSSVPISVGSLAVIKFIEQTASAKLNVAYFK